MCDPVSASLAITAVAGGVSAYGQYQQADAAKKSAQFNQEVANIQARDALKRGEFESEQAGRKVAQLRGRQRVALAANGLDLSYGSPADILEQTDYYGLEDQRTVANNARREASMFANRATMSGMQAASINPGFTAGTTLLGTAASVSDKWSRYNSQGPDPRRASSNDWF